MLYTNHIQIRSSIHTNPIRTNPNLFTNQLLYRITQTYHPIRFDIVVTSIHMIAYNFLHLYYSTSTNDCIYLNLLHIKYS